MPVILIPLVFILLAFDCQNLISRFRHAVSLEDESSEDYTILVPLFGNPDVLSNLEFLQKHKERVLLVLNTTNERMSSFAEQMENDGWKVHRTNFLEAKPRVSRLVQAGLEDITTTYVMRIDADTTSLEDPGRAIRALELRNADYASSKVLVNNPRSLAEHLQATEYSMAMLARHFRPWMTSGACIIAKTSALKIILSKHTHWWNGEDVEQGIIAKHYKMKVAHLDFHVYTDAPPTFKALYKQRKLWWAGNVRQSIMNLDQMIWFPAYLCYNVFLVYVAFLLRSRLLATTPLEFVSALPLMILLYILITTIANFQVRSKWFLVFPIYSLIQVTVMPAIGVVVFIKTAVKNRSTGRYLIGWKREKWIAPEIALPAE